MFKTSECIKNNKGFTLVELMVTVFLTAIAVISIYRGYTAFSQSADAQQQVMEMQQNLRIGMTRLAVDIRRAGMNEEYEKDAGFIAADATSVEFSMDLGSGGVFEADGKDNDDDGEIDEEDESRIGNGIPPYDDGERIKYSLYDEDIDNDGVLDPAEDDGVDDNGNGVLDKGWLRREVWDSATSDYVDPPQTLITNVEALNFVYFDEDGGELLLEETPPGSGVWVLSSGDLAKVDRVEITMVVHATNEDFRYTDKLPYMNLQGTSVYDPVTDAVTVYNPVTKELLDERHLRRRVFSMSVQIRNNI